MMMYKVAQLPKKRFLARYEDVFEHSPWIAEAVWDSNLDQQATAQRLHEAFEHVILRATSEKQLALLKAHPDLAVSVPDQQKLTVASKAEQKSAGLNRCTPEEFEEFQRLNASYREKFGFPFIMAVRGFDPEQILDAFRARMDNARDEEFQTALEQVILIGKFRIFERFEEPV
jgi:OHCU decarboxylase